MLSPNVVPSVLFLAVLALVFVGISWPVVVACDRHNTLSSSERIALALGLGPLAVYASVFVVGTIRLDVTTMWSVTAGLALLAVPGLRRVPWRQLLNVLSAEMRAGG